MPNSRIGEPDNISLIAHEFGRRYSHDQEIKRFYRLLADPVAATEGNPSLPQMNLGGSEVAFHDTSP
jgi:hypothetical protein